MRLLAHTALQYAGEEKRQFHAFSKWLRFCIDFEATEPESQSRLEMEARDAGVDINLVLDYIQFGLRKSDLTPYLRPEAQLDGVREASSYADTKKAVEVMREGGVFKEEALCLEYVLGHFKDGVAGLLRQVSKWQAGNIRLDGGVVLEEAGDGDGVWDMRMVFDVSSSLLLPHLLAHTNIHPSPPPQQTPYQHTSPSRTPPPQHTYTSTA